MGILPPQKSIPYGKQHITQADIDAVVKVLQSDWLTQGPKIPEFEQAFADYVGSKYAVAVSNGTAALHLCTLALGVKTGDIIITTPITFAASANCVRYAGGDVVFADIDPETYLLDINEVEKLLKVAPKGTYTGIIPVDFTGRAVNLEAFRKLADEYECWILEDACHAPGGYFVDSNGQKQLCGNGNFADVAIFSFHPVKHIATGEGGMITTNDKALYNKLMRLRTHGITKEAEAFQNTVELAEGREHLTPDSSSYKDFPGWYYEMQDLGYNYRITDFQAALGLSQLKRAGEGLKRRREIAQRYNEAFQNTPLIMRSSPFTNPGHAHHLYIIETEQRKALYDYLRKHKIFVQVHYIPVHLMPYYRQFGWKEGDLPNAEKYYNYCLSLPIYPSLSNEEQSHVIHRVNAFFEDKQ